MWLAAVLLSLAGLLHPAVAQRLCQRGWLYVNDRCWKYEDVPRTFDEARRQCSSSGASMASIHNDEENWFTYSLVQKYGGIASPFRLADDPRRSVRRQQPRPTGVFFAQAITDTSCFQVTRQALLFGFTEVAVEKADVEACKRECVNSQQEYAFECRSIMWYPQSGDCLLNSKRRNDDEETRILFQLVEGNVAATGEDGELVDYYDCDGFVAPPRVTPRPEERGCFRFWRESILVGYADEVIEEISVEECEQECLNADATYGFPCNSFMFYRRQTNAVARGPTCILNEATKDTILNATLFARDVDADYYEKLDRCPVEATEPPRQCSKRKLDVLFVVDGSGSIGPQSFEDLRKFLALMVSEMEVGFNDTNVGLIQFNESPYTEFPIRGFQTNDEVQNGIRSLRWRNGRTMIGRALQYALDQELIRSAGDRPTVPNVIITITDGLSQDDPSPPSQQLRALNMETYAIGITDAVFDEQLLAIAGSPNRVYKVRDFTQLDQNLKDAIIQQICDDDIDGFARRGDLSSGGAGGFGRFATPAPTRGREQLGGGSQGLWLGLQRQGSSYRWLDGSRLDYDKWRFG